MREVKLNVYNCITKDSRILLLYTKSSMYIRVFRETTINTPKGLGGCGVNGRRDVAAIARIKRDLLRTA